MKQSSGPPHPGIVLAARLRDMGLSANKFAALIRTPTNRVTNLIKCNRSITADTALRLGRLFNEDAMFWMDLQARFDLHVVGRKLARKLAKMPTQRERAAC